MRDVYGKLNNCNGHVVCIIVRIHILVIMHLNCGKTT